MNNDSMNHDENQTVKIPLSKTSKKYVDKFTIVDACDADLAQFNWAFNNGYAVRNAGSAKSKIRYAVHRVILERMLGRPLEKGEEVDHANMNRLDNRRSNLRLANRAQNMANRGKFRHNKSGYKGVSPSSNGRGWVAYIKFQDKHYYLGTFDTPQEAHETYVKKAKEFHGEFVNDGTGQPILPSGKGR